MPDSLWQLGGVSILPSLLRCDSPRVRHEAVLVALNVSKLPSGEGQDELMNANMLAALVATLDPDKSSQAAQEHAACSICNLSKASVQNKIALVKSGALRQMNRISSERTTSAQVVVASREMINGLSAVLTPTSRRTLVQAAMLPADSFETTSVRNFERASHKGSYGSCRRPSPLGACIKGPAVTPMVEAIE